MKQVIEIINKHLGKDAWKRFFNLLKKHPFKYALTYTAMLVTFFLGLSTDKPMYYIQAAILCALLFFFTWKYGRRAVLTVFLSATMANGQMYRPPPQPAIYALCGIAVIGGAAAVYVIYKCSKMVKPPRTNAPPEELWFSLQGPGGASGAADLHACGYCFEPPIDLVASFDYSETVAIGTVTPDLVSMLLVPENQTVTRAEFAAIMTSYGFEMTKAGSQYVENGRQVSQWESPYSFQSGAVPSVTCTRGEGPMVTKVVERTYDFQTYEPLLTNTSPASATWQFVDTTAAQAAFYRVTKL